ncbi:MAG: hypothetical protein HY727_20945 [Candidatus Rokubacteria bacterium]|nr:hypothetical protein [Candidatus Rokubacteria bacterium]
MVSGPVIARGAGLVVLGYLGWVVMARGLTASSAGAVLAVIDGANFIFHEAGHILFMFFGDFLQALGGSLTQVAIPAICALYFLSSRERAAAAVTLFWTGESITHVAIYIADGRLTRLPLHGGPGVIHDWNYLLTRLGLVAYAETLGGVALAVGLLTIVGALGLLAVDLLGGMRQTDHPRPMSLTSDLAARV